MMTVAQKVGGVKHYATLDGHTGVAEWLGTQYRFEGDDGYGPHLVGATSPLLVLLGQVPMADAQHAADLAARPAMSDRQVFRTTVATVAARAYTKLPESSS